MSSVVIEKIRALFANNAALGLLHLGFGFFNETLPPGVAFWRQFSQSLLNTVCQQARAGDDRSEGWRQISPPTAELQALLDQAPFMRGGEYLNLERLVQWWQTLFQQLIREVDQFNNPTLSAYLETHYPEWRKVGRVCFHLAENKSNPQRPFAFLATYSVRLSKEATLQHWPLSRALQEYAGESRRAQLLALLLPIQKVAAQCSFLKKLLDSQMLFHPLAWDSGEAYQFLQATPLMEAAGIVVRVPNWWNPKKPPYPQMQIKVGDKNPTVLGLDALLDFSAEMVLPNGERLTQFELTELLKTPGFVQVKGQWVALDPEKLNAVLAHWKKLERQTQREGLSWAEGVRWLVGAQSVSISTGSAELTEYLRVVEGEWLHAALAGLRRPQNSDQALQAVLQPRLQAVLRPYQQTGVQWLWRLYQLRLGGCLADDMGLGKTLQVLALLLLSKHGRSSAQSQKKPHLLIVPASLLGNWQAEIERFTPDLRVVIAHASASKKSAIKTQKQRREHSPDLPETDLVMTTYGTVLRLPWLTSTEWDIVILDEAQSIKNPAARQTQAIKTLLASVRLILTGTPIENRLTDLWSLFDFAVPGLLGAYRAFVNYAKKPDFHATVRRLVSPYILRRLKTDSNVIADLPDKTEMTAYCTLSKPQIVAYQQAVEELTRRLDQKDVEGIARRGLILSSLLHLKQICNHPSQWLGHGEYDPAGSGKFLRLQELAATIAAKQEKMLVFTQFREIIPALHDCLAGVFQRDGLMLHGRTTVKQRAQFIDIFQQESGPPFFVLSLKAGGVGLNLTAASHVIHFDRWWNPAVENQATDRAYRIGQKKNVLVHKFICLGTIEEKIDALICTKKALADDLLSSGEEFNLTTLNNQELLDMISLDIHQAVGGE
ncbi:MAG: DEAD/DEAH box helicase [Proteobacteria bacterium]|nr:DEAD/DEAH box helicase [Pseudomonadota bacterium]